MDDMISRQAAIERATKEHDFFRGAVTVSDKARRDELLNVICWLGELPSAQPEIIYCKDCKKHNKHYHESPYKDTVCPLTAWRGKARGHEYDYQYCCYAERREVTT